MPDGPARPDPERLGNLPEVTVSELAGALKRTVEDRFGHVRVRGEVSNYRGPHASGHAYFCLKDEGARIDAVIWRTTFGRMRVKPEEGLEIVATGKLTTYPNKSAYQIVIESLEPAGVGALMALLEERRRKLAAEGLFEAARKRALPFLPGVVGVVTSPTGAVIRDILHRVSDRFPRHVLVWPVRVQGEDSAAEVAAAIRGFNALPADGPIPRPDVLIVARGGGSLEDLWGFNDEAVVRAAFESIIPLVAAVGHETDWTLIDHAADVRAPTPTGAAELVVPVRSELLLGIDRLSRRHAAAMLRGFERLRTALRAAARGLPQAQDLLAVPRQRLDRAGSALPAGLERTGERRRLMLARLAGRLLQQSPRARLGRTAERLESFSRRLDRIGNAGVRDRRQRLDVLSRRLEAGYRARIALSAEQTRAARRHLDQATTRLRRGLDAVLRTSTVRLGGLSRILDGLSYRNVLARGYAIVRDETGQALRDPAAAPAGTRLDVELARGELKVDVVDAETPRLARSRPRRPPAPGRQGELF